MAFEKAMKLARLLRRPRYARAVLRHRVAATTEHLEPIRFCAPRTLVDVGANKGQFALAVRGLFPDARIHAFEPLREAADRFEALFRGDARVTLHRTAVGAQAESRRFFVTDRADSSSLLRPAGAQAEAYGVALARETSVPVRPLGALIDPAALEGPVMLKIDVQGAELEVLRGIEDLSPFDFIYVELSFVPLYEGQALFADVYRHLADRGFALRGVYNQSVTKAFGPTQADCLFMREGVLSNS